MCNSEWYALSAFVIFVDSRKKKMFFFLAIIGNRIERIINLLLLICPDTRIDAMLVERSTYSNIVCINGTSDSDNNFTKKTQKNQIVIPTTKMLMTYECGEPFCFPSVRKAITKTCDWIFLFTFMSTRVSLIFFYFIFFSRNRHILTSKKRLEFYI